ncbi:MAG: hypothetical protein ACJ8DX_01570 [Xanthobacteraceae bacterium]
MKRREFMALVGGAAMAWPLAARAQQGGRVRRIGWLSPGSGPNDATRSFLQGAREHGYLEGRIFSSNIVGQRARARDWRSSPRSLSAQASISS